MKFCECGSIKINDSCTNKKCQYHIKGTEFATFKQTDYIQGMLKQLEDDTEYDYRSMTQREASRIIDQLQDKIDLGG